MFTLNKKMIVYIKLLLICNFSNKLLSSFFIQILILKIVLAAHKYVNSQEYSFNFGRFYS